ncbi:primosomal protein DnaI [Bacillus paralicheniformis]|uniref:Helicase loader DnaI n=2 Tax=Bacillus paralicheniformis TaxID=1648923 RepID=A0A6N2GV93_9BACI|nr:MULTISPECIES: primosomal protein DnaI [Bacillus]KJD54614.1 primosomal protein DnaI [Bacillus amyloliquefaciens]KUL12153.1 primosomal protein DnaI [Bacillus licheniformis LMG 7559]MBC8623659.1 primosomal protein DnaI [Robertmurraya crescens]AGN37472.1 primosomal protein DnaI [Bacillus paralicheniformis ATCC 9945a]KFM92319.1 primosomal protein dnaI [Bacillus paralicheniformis]
MEPIKRALQGVTTRPDFQKRLEDMKEKVLSDKDVQEFLNSRQSEVDQGMIDRSLNKLYEFTQQSKACQDCPSLKECKNLIQGYHPKLVMNGKTIDVQYDRCPEKKAADERERQRSLIKSIYIQQDLLNATFADIDGDDPSRLKVLQLVTGFLHDYNETGKGKGIYVYGKFGVGKTFMLAAIANELAAKDHPSILVYVPEFVRELKNAIHDQSLEEKLEMVKSTPILMLDDIGAESMSSWVRDEVLGAILQHRMSHQLPTFFSSNFDPDELKHHFTYSQRGEKEEVKAARLMERVLYLATPVRLDGKNRRQ